MSPTHKSGVLQVYSGPEQDQVVLELILQKTRQLDRLQCFAIKTAVAFFERAAKSTVLAGIRSICHRTQTEQSVTLNLKLPLHCTQHGTIS
jgi:hypothetical protein